MTVPVVVVLIVVGMWAMSSVRGEAIQWLLAVSTAVSVSVTAGGRPVDSLIGLGLLALVICLFC